METKTTSRQVALRSIKIGDIFHAEGDNGGSLICLATSITGTVIYARTVTTQWDFKFDRRTGVGKEDKHSIQGTIDSVAALPPDIHEALIGLDERYRVGDSPRLTDDEKKALLFVTKFYPQHPI